MTHGGHGSMTLQSMTGFARAAAEQSGAVDRLGSQVGQRQGPRGCGCGCRPGSSASSRPARQAIQKRFSRGNIQATLTVGAAPGAAGAAGGQRGVPEGSGRAGQAPARSSSASRRRAPTGCWRCAACSKCPRRSRARRRAPRSTRPSSPALDARACRARRRRARAEGAALRRCLLGHIDAIEALTLRAEADPSREPAAIRQRLAEQVRLLMDAVGRLDESRLHMEAAFLATKADIREEIDRLKTHVASGARRCLQQAAPSAASSISWRRNSTANRILCARNRTPPR